MKTNRSLGAGLLMVALAAAPSAAHAQNVRSAGDPTTQPQNVVLTFQLIEADGFADTDPAIAAVVEELREVFRFRGYRLLETSVLRGALRDLPEEYTRMSQRLDLGEVGVFDLIALITRTQSANAFRVAVNVVSDPLDVVIMDASVTPRAGQTVVLGSARPNGAAGALILVMTAQLDD